MRDAKVGLLVLCSVVALIGCGRSGKTDQPSALKLENLLQMPLAEEFTPGREVIVSYVEIPPHTRMEQHWHPGEEFHYYLEGEVEIEIEGEPAITGRAGEVGHIPFGKMHTATTGDQAAKAIVFRVHTTGEPVRYLEGGGSEER
jgi:quercetin dioxygenase-like cupin family protein